MAEAPDTNQTVERVALLGLGGGGAAIVRALQQAPGTGRLELAVADTDRRALRRQTGIRTIEMGEGWNCDAGCGGDVSLGERAAEAAVDELRTFIRGARLLLVVAGLGGGTGSGGVRVVARIAREADVTAFFLLTLPFAFEGNWRRRQASAAVGPLREITDAVVVVPNDLLFTSLSADTPAETALSIADGILARAAHGLAAAAWADWLLMADFATLRSVLRQFPDPCHLGVGVGHGENRWQEAVQSFIECPFTGGAEALGQAEAAIVTLMAGTDISVGELQSSLSAVQERLPDRARVLVGACTCETAGDTLQITGIICQTGQAYPRSAPLTGTTVRETPANPTLPGERPRRQATVQAELPFQEQTLGVFTGTAPTTVGGENLDIPTYQRKGVTLDVGD